MKRVALINDLSSLGRCSLTAAIPVISVMGIQACPFPTAILSAQTEFEDYFCDDFTDKMDYFTEQWKSMDMSFDGIYSGYLASSLQIEKVFYFLKHFKKENTLYLLDPVMGDDGIKYDMFHEEFLEKMKELVLYADVITPNLTELCLLAGEDYEEVVKHQSGKDYIKKIQAICERLISRAHTDQIIIVTGIIRDRGKKHCVGNLAVSKKEVFYIENIYTQKHFSGTGDLFASVICGSLVKGLSVREAMKKATFFLQDAIKDSSKQNTPTTHGVEFEKYLHRL